ncbi:MAG: NB-ARC domain-containing protein, partial [Pseudomonadota bacterium]
MKPESQPSLRQAQTDSSFQPQLTQLKQDYIRLFFNRFLDAIYERLAVNAPRIFISYVWKDANDPTEQALRNETQVHELASLLKRAGIDVVLDLEHNQIGTSIQDFTHEIASVDCVILACSQRLITRFEKKEGVISQEIPQIISRFAQGQSVMTLYQDGDRATVVPAPLQSAQTIDACQPRQVEKITWDIIQTLISMEIKQTEQTKALMLWLRANYRDYEAALRQIEQQFETFTSEPNPNEWTAFEKRYQTELKLQTHNYAKRHIEHWQPPVKPIKTLLREHIFSVLDTAFHRDEKLGHALNVTILGGETGIGKKTVLQQYWHQQAPQTHQTHRWSLRAWFNSPDETTLQQSYFHFGQTLGIISENISLNASVECVKQWLARHPGWLCIYTDAGPWVKNYWPSLGGDIIVTSSHPDWQHDIYDYYTVGGLTASESERWLSEQIGMTSNQYKDLAAALNYHPARLQAAIDYCRRFKLKPETYLTRYLAGEIKAEIAINLKQTVSTSLDSSQSQTVLHLSQSQGREHLDDSNETQFFDETTARQLWQREALDRSLQLIAHALDYQAPRCALLTASETDVDEAIRTASSNLIADLKLAGLMVERIDLSQTMPPTTADWWLYLNSDSLWQCYQQQNDFQQALHKRLSQKQETQYQRNVLAIQLLTEATPLPSLLNDVVYADLRHSYANALLNLIAGIYRSGQHKQRQDIFYQAKTLCQRMLENEEKDELILIQKQPDYAKRLQAQQHKRRQPPSNHKTFNLPAENPEFVGRKALLNTLQRTLKENQRLAITAVQGMGGVGKSQLALHYAHHHPQKDYHLVAWLLAETESTFFRDCLKLGVYLQLFNSTTDQATTKVQLVKRYLENHPGWLVVIDNADEAKWLENYLPTQGGDIIITSRQPDWFFAKTLDVNLMDEADAVTLLSNSSQRLQPEDKVTFKLLAKTLGYLPLALSLAGDYLCQHPEITTQVYLDKFSSQLKYDDAEDSSKNLHRILLHTWEISMQSVRKIAPDAEHLLLACALLAPDRMPTDYLLTCMECLINSDMGKADASLPRTAVNARLTTTAIGRKLSLGQLEHWLWILVNYSLIQIQAEGMIGMHRLVQLILRQTLNSETLRYYLGQLIITMNKDQFISRNLADQEVRTKLLLPHRETLWKHSDGISFSSAFQGGFLADLGVGLGNYYFSNQSDPKKAMQFYKTSLDFKTIHFGSDHLVLVHILINLGNTYGKYSDREKQKRLQLHALDILEKRFGPNHW